MAQSDQWGSQMRMRAGPKGPGQGGLTIEQPGDSGHWGSPHRALQHKVLALNDGAVPQDTGEGGGHLHHGHPCEGKEQTGHLRSQLAHGGD